MDNLTSMAKATSKELEEVLHLEASLLQTYVEEENPAHPVTPWSRQTLEHAISNGPHS